MDNGGRLYYLAGDWMFIPHHGRHWQGSTRCGQGLMSNMEGALA